MTTHRTSPHRFAAAIVGTALAACGSTLVAQDIPVVRPRSEIFGDSSADAARSPFSVPEPDWQSAGLPVPLQGNAPEPPLTAVPVTPAAPEPELVPVQSLQLSDLGPPVVDAAAAKLVSPVREVSALPVLKPLEESDPVDRPLPAFAPKRVDKKSVESPATEAASADDLEGMLHNMVWVTGTIGLGAVVSLWMLRMWLTRGGRSVVPTKSLKLVDTLRIGPRCGVYLVEAEKHRVLVGVEHGKTMCLMPLPESFTESLEDATDEPEEPRAAAGFERVADVFAALRKDEKSKGAKS
ncbi:MAG TPA: flagellar biosynthetic protein FliO [Caulifigura sp.]|jgi:flagellar biogenesis protein FliO|nr:flagellar biosynthetic protein FliO [Caulifigura sp.]